MKATKDKILNALGEAAQTFTAEPTLDEVILEIEAMIQSFAAYNLLLAEDFSINMVEVGELISIRRLHRAKELLLHVDGAIRAGKRTLKGGK